MFNSTLKAMLLWVMLTPSLVFGGGFLPDIPKNHAKQCVRPTEEMRVHHMDYLLHQRNKTMHQGIRTKQFSLKHCINCHVEAKPDGSYPSVREDPKEHFCGACHQFAAVHIDCFECHSDKPESATKETSNLKVVPHGH